MKKCLIIIMLFFPSLSGYADHYRDFFWSQTGGGPEGGYIYDVEIVPPDGSLIFLATENSGVYRSLDGGQIWDKVGLNELIIRTIAVDPADTDIVYAGSAEGRVYKSEDRGRTWIEKITGLGDEIVMDLLVHPADSSCVFAATYGDGVMISHDGGETWNASNTGLSRNQVNRIVIDPNNVDRVYAGVYSSSVPLNVSIDRGQTWTSLSDGLPSSTCRDIHVFHGDSNIIFIGLEGQYLYRTYDGGVTWERIDNANGISSGSQVYTVRIHPTDPLVAFLGTRYSGGFKTIDGGDNWTRMGESSFQPYVRFLAQHPLQADTLFMGTLDGEGVFLTTDAGETWNSANKGLTNVEIMSLAIHPATQNLLYAGTRNLGVFRSTNYGRTWEERNVQLGSMDIYCLETVQLDVYAGTPNGIYRGLDGGNIWAELTEGISYSDDIHCLAINPGNASNIVLGSVSVDQSGEYKGGIYTTINKGELWTPVDIAPDKPSSVTVYDLVFAQPAGRMWAATSHGVYRSNDYGQSWLPTAYINHRVNSVAYDSKNGGTIYAGSVEGIHCSRNSGSSWDLLVSFISADDLAVDESRSPSWVYAVSDLGVFVSEDNGINWSTTNHGLTNRRGSAMVIDRFDPDILYLGTTGSGVFTTADATPPEIPVIVDAYPLDRGIHVEWQLGTENDLAGYRVYYDTDSPIPPFSGMTALEGPSPVDIGIGVFAELFGFANGLPVYVAVTAYDEVGNESYYSEVQTILPNLQPFIVMAGYADSYLDASGGTLKMIAWAMDSDEDVIEKVDLYLFGNPVDFSIPSVGGGIFQVLLSLPAGMAPFQEVFEMVAFDETGAPSSLWPYLAVREAAWGSGMTEHAWAAPERINHWWQNEPSGTADPPTRNGPFVYAAGLNVSRISTEEGGTLNLIAVVMDYESDISGVELFYSGLPTGVFLKDDGKSGDFAAGDNIYGLLMTIPPNAMPAMNYLLEIKAYNSAGRESDLWPYLTVH